MVSAKQKVPTKMLKDVKRSNRVEKQKKTKSPVLETVKLIPKQDVIQKDIKKKKTKFVMPSKYITESIVNSCLNALEKVIAEQGKNKNAIFDDEKPIFVEIHSMKIQNTNGSVKFILPHSTVASTGEVCLITPDIKKGRKHDHEPTVDRWEDLLRNAGVTTVKTVLPLRQLRVEYDQYELKRRLLTQHDFIMVDTRVLNHASHMLGKMFLKKHHMLIPVRLDNDRDLKQSLDKGLRTAILRLSEGETSTVIVGHTAMPQDKVKENILSLVDQIKTKFPGGEANIRALRIKLPLSVALPLYLTLRPSSTVTPPKLTQKKPKHYTVLEDELSTMPGKIVSVAPDGTVNIKKSKDELRNSNDSGSEMDDESEPEAQESDQSE